MKFGKIFSAVLAVSIICGNSSILPAQSTFKDASPKMKAMLKDFDDRGILNEFILKYGTQYFRPTTSVTREDLLFALYEYDRVVKTLMNYRSQLTKSVLDLRKRLDSFEQRPHAQKTDTIDNKQIDLIAKEIQDRLPLLLYNVPIPRKIEDKFESLKNQINSIDSSGQDTGKFQISSSNIKKIVQQEVKRIMAQEGAVTLSQSYKKHSLYAGNASHKLMTKLTISLGMLAAIFLAR